MKSSKRIIVLSSFVVAGLAVGVTFQNCAPNKLSAQSINPMSASLGTASLSSTAGEYYGSNDGTTSTTGSSSSSSSTTSSSSSSSVPTASFGGGDSTTSSSTSAVSTFVPQDSQATYTSNAGTSISYPNSGLSYNDAIRLRALLIQDGKVPYVYVDPSGGFTVIQVNQYSANWADIQKIKAIQSTDWNSYLYFAINDIA